VYWVVFLPNFVDIVEDEEQDDDDEKSDVAVSVLLEKTGEKNGTGGVENDVDVDKDKNDDNINDCRRCCCVVVIIVPTLFSLVCLAVVVVGGIRNELKAAT
jgi:hypothetical protein